MTSSEGPGFQYGDDFVAARLAFDVPTDGISSLRELTQEIDRFRTGVEAAGRAQDNFTRYLSQTAEAAERAAGAQDNLVAAMQRTVELQERLANGSATAGGVNVPQGYVDPFANARAGHGGGGRSPSEVPPVDLDSVQGQISSLQQNDPRAYLNMQAQRGNLRTGDLPADPASGDQLQQAASRVAARDQQVAPLGDPQSPQSPSGAARFGQGAGVARGILNELTPGGLPPLVNQGLGAMSNIGGGAAAAGGLQGGALAGLRAAGVAGGIATAGLAAYGLTQAGGEAYQSYKNQGLLRGGGATDGFGQEMAIRTLAMNPFLSTEQSRQVIQGALTEGYQGKAFDTATGFIAHNLTEMNMSVSDSIGLLRKNVHEGGQSLVGLNASLGMLKELSQDGARTLPELIAGFSATSGALVNAGVGGPQAAHGAMVAGQMWSGDQTLKGQGESILAQLASSPSGQAAAFAMSGTPIPQGAQPGTLFARTGDGGAAATSGMMKKFAQIAHGSSRGDVLNGAAIFQTLMQRYAPSSEAATSLTVAQQMYESLLSGKDPNAEAERNVANKRHESLMPREKGIMEAAGGFLGGLGEIGIGALTGTGRAVGGATADFFTGKWQGANAYSSKIVQGMEPGTHDLNPTDLKMPVLDNIISAYGSKGFEVLSNGKPIQFDRGSPADMAKLAAGEYQWRPKGARGSGFTAQEVSGLSGDDLKGYRGAGGGGQMSGSVTLGLTPEAQRLLQPQGGPTIQLTPHEQRANMGYGDATPNNAPPGEGPMTRGMR